MGVALNLSLHLPRSLPESQADDAQLVWIDSEQPEAETVKAGGDVVGHRAGEPYPDPAAGPALRDRGHAFE